MQSNQYPRALALAKRFRARGVQVAIGGFHVSGVLSMLKKLTPELQEAVDLGIILFAGEAEEHFEGLIKDAANGAAKTLYNYMDDLPDLRGTPAPVLPARLVKRYDGVMSSFDAGRGCPFHCSFCTIINVQGRKSRWRDADDIEKILRANAAQGVRKFFITDDNFARNRNWEPIFDRMIELSEREGLHVHFFIQVDTLAHKIPNFVEKAARAGCRYVFVGLESINAANLVEMGKAQNRITEYRKTFQAWKKVGVLTYAGYILGLPDDSRESIRRDIEVMQRELPVDLVEFTMLTPLPGSEDHKRLYDKGVWMEPDLNAYDLENVTLAHPKMTKEEWQQTYFDAWDWYYTPAHVETLARRNAAYGIKTVRILRSVLQIVGSIRYEGVHPLQGGYFRIKQRLERRPGMAIEFSASILRQARRRADAQIRGPDRRRPEPLEATPPHPGRAEPARLHRRCDLGSRRRRGRDDADVRAQRFRARRGAEGEARQIALRRRSERVAGSPRKRAFAGSQSELTSPAPSGRGSRRPCWRRCGC